MSLRVIQLGAPQMDVRDIAIEEAEPLKLCLSEDSVPEVGTFQDSAAQIGPRQVGLPRFGLLLARRLLECPGRCDQTL